MLDFQLTRRKKFSRGFEEDSFTNPKIVSDSRKDENSDEREVEQGWVEMEK